MISWHLRSWQNAKQEQQPDYPEPAALDRAVDRLSELPPLVTPDEVNLLKQQIAEAAEGKRFIIQAGDCAESFSECSAEAISRRVKILQQMSLVLMQGYSKPVTTIGRIAGQYAKPRSSALETIGDLSLPCYRGDLINNRDFTLEARTADPERLLEGYGYASMTLNYIRSLKQSSFSALKDPKAWLEPLLKSDKSAQEQLSQVGQSLTLLNNLQQSPLASELYTSHEALHLHYEQALTRQHQDKWYNLSTHFPWVGMRTAKPGSAHIEYLRGISNPLAIKIGPSISADELLQLIETLNPEKESGRITLISRFGAQQISTCLPPLIKAVEQSEQTVLWSCDPMHGNTRITKTGLKTRDIEAIHEELKLAFQIHQENQSQLGAVHLEISGNNITECTGGLCQLTDAMLDSDYQSLLDPRLSRAQSLEISLLIIREVSKKVDSSLYLASTGG